MAKQKISKTKVKNIMQNPFISDFAKSLLSAKIQKGVIKIVNNRGLRPSEIKEG